MPPQLAVIIQNMRLDFWEFSDKNLKNLANSLTCQADFRLTIQIIFEQTGNTDDWHELRLIPQPKPDPVFPTYPW